MPSISVALKLNTAMEPSEETAYYNVRLGPAIGQQRAMPTRIENIPAAIHDVQLKYICSVVALGADDRALSIRWQTKAPRPLIVAKDAIMGRES